MASSSKTPDQKTPEEIRNNFKTLKTELQKLSSKLSEFEGEFNEHKMVIEILQNVDEDRRCFRSIGGVLTERKVKDVLPAVALNLENIKEFIEILKEQVIKKETEIIEYKEKYNITYGGPDIPAPKQEEPEAASGRGENFLVS